MTGLEYSRLQSSSNFHVFSNLVLTLTITYAFQYILWGWCWWFLTSLYSLFCCLCLILVVSYDSGSSCPPENKKDEIPYICSAPIKVCPWRDFNIMSKFHSGTTGSSSDCCNVCAEPVQICKLLQPRVYKGRQGYFEVPVDQSESRFFLCSICRRFVKCASVTVSIQKFLLSAVFSFLPFLGQWLFLYLASDMLYCILAGAVPLTLPAS